MQGLEKRYKSEPLVLNVTEVRPAGHHSIRIYGRLENGESICAKTDVFRPYFYVQGQRTDAAELTKKLRVTFGPVDLIERIDPVYKIPLMGYHPDGAIPMQRITMTSPKYLATCRDMLQNEGLATYEGNVQYEMRYMVDKGFGGNDWIQINQFNPALEIETRCTHEVDFNGEIEKLERSDICVHQRWLAFDIEACKGGSGRGFVNPKEDMVSQIGNTLYNSKYETLDRRVFSMGGTVAKLPQDIEVQAFTDEREMLLAWRDYIIARDPDVFTGYNIDGFDWWYLFERAKKLGIFDEFRAFSRDLNRPCTIKKATFQSAAKGAREDYEVYCEGRFGFDMYKFIKDTKKLRSYKLGKVSEELLGDTKVEMPYEDIPVYQAGTDEQRAHLCYYCWYDADLCMRLMKKRMAIVNYVETARVCGVPMKFLITRGQQVLTHSLLLRYGQKRGLVVPSSTENQNDEDTKGATVLEPLRGFYKCWIMVLDFRSLYPSIIRDKNICYSTKTPLAWAKKHLKPTDYYVPPIDKCNYCFVKEHIMVGLLAEIEETLFNKRNEAKADLKRETDPDKKDVLDGRQLAIKVRMNSIYGFLKANMVCDKDLMETVTSVGRSMIDGSKKLVEERFPGAQVVYGDSVTGDTPCLVKDIATGCIDVITIDSFGSTWETRQDGKEYLAIPPNFLVWTEEGWTGIRQVIRHRADKPLVRVLTHTGVVDCTTDHGLITADGLRVDSKDVKIGDSLLHSFPTEWEANEVEDGPIDAGEARVWGFVLRGKCVPRVILNASYEFRKAFWDGYREGESCRIEGKKKACSVFTLLKTLGHTVSVEMDSDTFVISTGRSGCHEKAIKKITALPPTTDYVYDLETENHHFHAGVGQLIVHNTDSIFVKFGEGLSIEEAFEKGEQAAALCTNLFTQEKDVHLLQMEKGFYPLLLCGKKKYAGYKYMSLTAPPFVDSSGLENVRRDNALIASETQARCLDMILREGDYDAARSIAYVRQVISDLLMGRIEMSKLIISKNLSKSFKHYEESGSMLPHVELAKKIVARGDEAYHTGDRVKFVVICGPKGAKSSECAEDPAYALRNRVAIDYNYYVYNQMMKPLLRIFTPILAPHERMTKENKSGKTVYINDEEVKRLTAYKVLFTGDHMMHKVHRVKEGTGDGLMKWAKKLPSCVGCGCRIKSGPLCASCKPHETGIFLQLKREEQELERQGWAAWTRCQMCVGDKHVHKIHCSNKDCDNFYQREKVIYDIEDLAEKLARWN